MYKSACKHLQPNEHIHKKSKVTFCKGERNVTLITGTIDPNLQKLLRLLGFRSVNAIAATDKKEAMTKCVSLEVAKWGASQFMA